MIWGLPLCFLREACFEAFWADEQQRRCYFRSAAYWKMLWCKEKHILSFGLLWDRIWYNRGICNFQSSEIISLSLISSQMKSNNVICGIKKCQSVKQTHFHIAMFFETPPYLIYIHIIIYNPIFFLNIHHF